MTQRKRFFEKTHKRNGLKKVVVVYAQFVDVESTPFVTRYDLFDDNVYVDSITPSGFTNKIVEDFLNGVV